MIFLKKTHNKVINIFILSVFVIIASLILISCSLFAGMGGRDNSSNGTEGPLPSFSASTVEFIDINGGDTYPGENLGVNITVLNNGDMEANNVKVDLACSNVFTIGEGETSWNVDVLGAGDNITFDTNLSLVEKITEDMLAWCRLEISSDEVESFTSSDFGIMVYGVRHFEGNYIPIIGLHAIEDDIGAAIELYTSYFDKLCEVLKEYGYETITFTDLLNYIDFGKALPEKPVIITSDDGFQDVYTNGFPILKKYGYKMTVFLVTGAVGETEAERTMNAYFEKEVNESRPIRPVLIWPEIEEMYEYGCEFQSHTVNHVRLGLASDEEVLYELTQSKEDIESHLGNNVLFVALPKGNYNPDKWPLILEAGYRGAVRNAGGIEDVRTIDLSTIYRVELNSLVTPNQYVNYLNLDRSIEIEYIVDSYTKKAGEEFTVEYIIKNTNEDNARITSLEFELPDNIELVGVSPDGHIDQYPGLSDGIYIWVSDSYIINENDEINLIVRLKGVSPRKSFIKFRVTYHENYIDCDDIEMNIET